MRCPQRWRNWGWRSMQPEGSHQPERALQVVPDLHFHGGVVEHVHMIGIVLLIFGKRPRIILAPLFVGLESRETPHTPT